MKRVLAIVFILSFITSKTAAQLNWAAVPCFELKKGDAIYRITNNDVHNELILCNDYRTDICGSNYVAVFAYNGDTFHAMDLGVDVQNPNTWLGSTTRVGQCVEWNGKALVTGIFTTVGSNTLLSKYMAVWNGTVWDTFPHPFWSNRATQAANTMCGMGKILKDNGNIWMFPGFDTAGTSKYLPYLYNGTSFTALPEIPVNNKNQVVQAVKYHNKLIVTGNFLNYPSLTFFRLAQWDGTSWSELGNGAPGNLTGTADLAVYNDTLYIAGNFSKSDGCKGNYMMKWDGNQLTDAGFGGWCGYGPVRKLIPFKNRLYAFGGFNCAANQKAFGVAYYENGTWTVPQDSIENGVFDATVYKDAIYIGGMFTSINGDSSVHQFAKLTCPDFDAANGCLSGIKETKYSIDFSIYPNPTNDKIKIQYEQSYSIDKITFTNTLGQEIYTIINPELKKEIDITNFPAGIYFLKAQNKQAQGVYKVVKE